MKSSLSVISFMDYAFSVVSKNSWWNPRSQFSPVFYPRNLIVCILYLDLLFIFWVNFCKGCNVCLDYCCCCCFQVSSCPRAICWKKNKHLFFYCIAVVKDPASLSEISWLYLYGSIWGLSVLFYRSVYSFSDTTCFDYYSFTVSL